jgi:L-asparaginase
MLFAQNGARRKTLFSGDGVRRAPLRYYHDPMTRIYVLSTGGTIEKIYSEQQGAVYNRESKIEGYLKRLRMHDTEVLLTHLMNKDSLDMTAADREAVLQAVRERPDAPIVITHGTDTMVDTGLCIRNGVKELSHPIVLTGAMSPLGFEGSDGLQNLTESFLAAKILPPGVYVVIHNEVFPIDHVRKDRERARFVRAYAAPPVAAPPVD